MNASTRLAGHQVIEKQSTLIKRPGSSALPAPDGQQAPDNTPEKQRSAPVGTERANYSKISSGASSPERRWGGKRNSAARTSESLSLNQAANIIATAKYAAAISLPLNRHLTIHWEQAGIPDERAAWATGRFLKLAGDWIAKRGGRIAWAWVRENGDGKGSHVHILIHVPAGARLGDLQRRWLRTITGRAYKRSTIETRRIGGTAGAARAAPAHYQLNLSAVVGYVLKGVGAATAVTLCLERHDEGGQIVGKRAATSQNIGRAARSTHAEFHQGFARPAGEE